MTPVTAGTAHRRETGIDPFEIRLPVKPLSTCWVLANHWDDLEGQRTWVGELVYDAKTYPRKPGSRETANELAALMAHHARSLVQRKLMRRPDLVVPVPANPPKHPHNLPEVLCEAVAEAVGAQPDNGLLRKTRATPVAKTSSREHILANLDSAFELSAPVTGQRVIVDDLVRTGAATLSVIGSLLTTSGALPESFAYVATRATVGLRT